MAMPKPTHRPRRPQHPPHPTGGRPPVLDTGGQPRPSRVSRKQAIQRAVGAVRNAFMEQGVDPTLALKYARVILSRPKVEIGRGGTIYWKGQAYKPDAFATSGLANLITGKTAETKNEAAIKGDPGYLQAIAQLGLARDQATAGLSDQQRQALIQFGDPSFITDPTLAAEANANPFSDSRLLAAAYQNQQQAVRQSANNAGVFQGGGLTSGLNEAQRQYAGQNQDAVTKLQQLLASINLQQAQAQQAYGVGQDQAFQDAYQALLASGAIKPAQAPNFAVSGYSLHHPARPAGGGGGGGGAGGTAPGSAPQPGPPRGTYPTQGGYPVNVPPTYNPTGTNMPARQGFPTQTTYPSPVDFAALQRRYGVYG